jgi:hypothetical protein
MWKRTETERPGKFEIDKSFLRINCDGTQERIRFVKYPNTPTEWVEKLYYKIKGTENETARAWEMLSSTEDTIHVSEFRKFDNSSHRLELLFKTLISC